MTRIAYPETRTVDFEDRLAGLAFADPYHWLEEETDEVRQWQSQQATLATSTIRAWPHFDTLKASVERFNVPRFSSAPRSAGGHWFRLYLQEGRTQAVVVVSNSPAGEGRVLLDPSAETPDHPAFIAWMAPSPDGRILALGLCTDGSEHNRIRLIDVDSGAMLADPPTQTLMDAWTGGAQWLADGSGFYFTALIGSESDFQQRIFHYDIAKRLAREVPVPLIDVGLDYCAAKPSTNGRWVVAMQRAMTPIPVAVLDLQSAEKQWRPFITRIEGAVAGHVVGDHYIAVTDIGAPRGRVVAITLTSSNPNDPSTWIEIVPESEAAIRAIRPIGDMLYVTELVDTYGRVRIFTRDGQLVGQVPLPGRGAIAEPYVSLTSVCAPSDQTTFVFGFSTLTTSWGTYLHRPGADHVKMLVAPQVKLEGALIEDHWAVSRDGTRIPYHIVRMESATPDGARAALLNGYGGYNIPWIPQFPGAMLAFVAAGGLFVHCHLRGGSDFGFSWWDGGRLKNKQNGYDDLYAIAEALIARGISQPDLMAVTGGSNGGLMAGVAAVQRPDLWRVCVPRVPALDLIADCRDAYGRSTTAMEYADPDDPQDVQRMATFSPYQLIKKGSRYPAVYIDAGATDPRCAPWHARKFAARLQAAQAGDAPIFVHIWENVGHGAATAKNIQVEQNSEWLAFVMQQVGLTP